MKLNLQKKIKKVSVEFQIILVKVYPDVCFAYEKPKNFNDQILIQIKTLSPSLNPVQSISGCKTSFDKDIYLRRSVLCSAISKDYIAR